MVKKICVITGSRADYGIMLNLLSKIKNDQKCKLQIIVTNMHLEKKYGYTYKEIIKDGFKISKKIKLPLKKNSIGDIVVATSVAIKKFNKTLDNLNPDLVIVLGDRYEVFAGSFVTAMKGIPLAHIHGGELSYGVIDERIRHAISKLSDLHFTSTQRYKQRLQQMGEQKKNIHYVGSLGVERIKKTKLLSKFDFEKKINFELGNKSLLFTYHPTTNSKKKERLAINSILNSLKKFKTLKIIFTLPNSDAYSDEIRKKIINFSKTNPKKYRVFKSMSQSLYYCAMKYCSVIFGNSSSGIIEAPSINSNIINLGDRQEGRMQSKSIKNCLLKKKNIIFTINNIINNNKKIQSNPYYKKNTSSNILKIIKRFKKEKKLKKIFYESK
jgi:GDP/UDP-N,N'-diacetylbacillosamine 2-epimerase (hydrolysing)